MQHSKSLRAVLLVCIFAIVIGPGLARAEQGNMGSEGGMGALAALSTLLYGPIKIVYAGAGLVIGGIAWVLSGGDSEVMSAVVTPAVRGDYVVSPSHLRGERPLEFFGRDPRYRPEPAVVEQTY